MVFRLALATCTERSPVGRLGAVVLLRSDGTVLEVIGSGHEQHPRELAEVRLVCWAWLAVRPPLQRTALRAAAERRYRWTAKLVSMRSPNGRIWCRKPHVGDAPALSRVITSAWQVGFEGMIPQDFLDRLDPSASCARWEVDLSPARVGPPHFLIAEKGGYVVAFSAFGPSRDEDASPDVGAVFAIHVAPERWGEGVGSTLLSSTVVKLRSLGFAAASLWVIDRNARARRFYERHGWQVDGAERDSTRFCETSIHEVRYRLALD